jgi:hypothetical protein
VRTDVIKVKFVDRDELKLLWRVLERLQADVTPVGGASVGRSYVWKSEEIDALATVMDAVKDTYLMEPMTDAQRAEMQKTTLNENFQKAPVRVGFLHLAEHRAHLSLLRQSTARLGSTWDPNSRGELV